MTRKRTHNKHVKKYRKVFTKEELKVLYQRARQKAKTELKNNHIKEYHKIVFKHLKKLKMCGVVKEKIKKLY